MEATAPEDQVRPTRDDEPSQLRPPVHRRDRQLPTRIFSARIEAAKRGLETTRPEATVAWNVGYEDVVAFRRMFARTRGLAA
jgi:hypothetical protein